MRPQSQDRRAPKRMNENVNGHPNPEMPLLPTPDNSSAADSVNPDGKSDSQQPEQPTVPAALPTPSLTPTPTSRSSSNVDQQNSDAESVHDEGLEIPNGSRPSSEANSVQTYKPWQENGQGNGYIRRPPPYQRIDPHHHNVSPPSPISAPATPVTASSASSTHGNLNHVTAQQIQVSAPIMPGPVKEICYTKDINLVMEECMMGHGKTGRDSVMRRTANWQHQVGCMMCSGYGGPGGEKAESGAAMAGKHWLWLCSWCALRVCADCRCTLAEEEDHLREKGGSVGTLKVNLKALRVKIIEGKKQEQERNSAEAAESLSEDNSEKLERNSTEAVEGPLSEGKPEMLVGEKLDAQQGSKESLRTKVEPPSVKIEAQETRSDPLKKVAILQDNTAPMTVNQSRTKSPAPFAVQHDRLSTRAVNASMQSSLTVSASSKESVNSFATAGSHVESNSNENVIGPAVEVHKKKTVYPPRVSSRNPATETKAEPNVPNKGPALSSPETVAESKQAGVPVTPKPLSVQTSTKAATSSSANTTVIVSAPVISPPKSPHSPSRPFSASATTPSIAPQAAVADASKTDTTAAVTTFAQAPKADSSLRAVVSPEMLALITGIPVTQQPKAATVDSKPTPALPAKPHSSTRDLTAAFAPPPAPAKPSPPSRHATASPPPPQSSSSTLLSPIAQVKSLISATSSTLHQNKRNPVTPASPSSAPTVEKFSLPPLSFESEISNEIDNIFGTREYTAPKAQTTHAEETYKHKAVEPSPKGGRRWYRSLFGGKK